MRCRTRCWPPGKASAGSRDAPRCARGCTGSPRTVASTRAARPADARPGRGTCRISDRTSRHVSARSCGSSRIPMPVSRAASTCRSGRRRATSRPKPSRWPSSTALQVLPPRQVAVLVLRDVLGFPASEVAGMLDATTESVNSALKRARAGLQRGLSPTVGREPPPAAGSPAEEALVAQFARAWEAADLGALVDLLTDDAFISMPPDAVRVRGSRRRGPLLRRPVRHGPPVRPRARRAPTASRRSARTCAPRRQSAAGPASTCSPSPGTGSAR